MHSALSICIDIKAQAPPYRANKVADLRLNTKSITLMEGQRVPMYLGGFQSELALHLQPHSARRHVYQR